MSGLVIGYGVGVVILAAIIAPTFESRDTENISMLACVLWPLTLAMFAGYGLGMALRAAWALTFERAP